MAVTPDDIIASAEKLLGVPYRHWYLGDSIPMWVDDGYTDSVPDRAYFEENGVECSDLINFALWDNGLSGIEGTEMAINYLQNMSAFDFWKPGEKGAVAYLPYTGPWQQGHIALYWDERYLIQAIGEGVTYKYTDQVTWNFADGSCQFSHYGYLPGVAYPSQNV
jgi:hypothetical protein